MALAGRAGKMVGSEGIPAICGDATLGDQVREVKDGGCARRAGKSRLATTSSIQGLERCLAEIDMMCQSSGLSPFSSSWTVGGNREMVPSLAGSSAGSSMSTGEPFR